MREFFCFLARKGAEAQRKNPLAAWRLCALTSFFPKGATRLNPLPPACGRQAWREYNQSTQPQGAGGVSIGLVRSNRTENSVADPSLLKL